jgi:hypothetical protein
LESPTGEFMTVGVLQSFEFPSVYVKQGQLAKAANSFSRERKNTYRSRSKTTGKNRLPQFAVCQSNFAAA